MTHEYQSLDYQVIEKASEKYENLKEVLVLLEVDGKLRSYSVEMYKHFSTVQITQCVREIIEKLDHLRVRNKGEIERSVVVPYMIFLIIKHFTTLNLPNTFAEQLKAIENMTNTGAMFQILMAFDENEVAKVQSEVNRVLENFDKNLEEVEDLKRDLMLKITDKTLLE